MTTENTPDLVRRLKRLRLGGLLPTLPDRVAHARQAKRSPLELLELLLQDEIDRRNSHGLALRLAAAGFEELVSFDEIVWDTPVSYDRPRVRALFALQWLAEHDNVIFCEPVEVGQSFLAQALGHQCSQIPPNSKLRRVGKWRDGAARAGKTRRRRG